MVLGKGEDAFHNNSRQKRKTNIFPMRLGLNRVKEVILPHQEKEVIVKEER